MPVGAVAPPSEKTLTPMVQEPLGPTWDYFVKTNDTLKKIVIGYNKDLGKQGYALLTVSQVLAYHHGENELAIDGEIELDIREAPLRELVLRIPKNYAVARLNACRHAASLLPRKVAISA